VSDERPPVSPSEPPEPTVAAESLAVQPAQDAEPSEPQPSPFAHLSPQAGRVAANAFEALARSSADLRRASFYIGLLFTAAVAPAVILVWQALASGEFLYGEVGDPLAGPMTISLFIALAGIIVCSVESRAIAPLVLASRIGGRRLEAREAVGRARTVFWRVVRASILVSVPLFVVQFVLEAATAQIFQGESEASVVTAALLAAAVVSPFVYAVSGVVLGDVRATEAVRRSVRLFRARKAAAVVVALFAWGADLLTGFGFASAADLLFRADFLGDLFASRDLLATIVSAAILIALVFALGTLLFTVTAISLAPQVSMFLALTHVAPGLDAARPDPATAPRRFWWLTWPYLAMVAVDVLVVVAGLNALSS
jgi:hypothetical protein